ncbi:MAG: hypothetical protein IBX66_10930 [Lutibacter sp.]|nr:hypothetical protein [Lutibacter sp.]
MNNLQKTLKEISQLTKTIETNYPELYQFLDESPMTIPSEGNPSINKKTMQDYLDSLKQLLKHHLETRKKIENHNNKKQLSWEK